MDPYKILGVEEKASLDEIKISFRKLVKKHHPDTGGNDHKILLINAAWEILGDKENRKIYDSKRFKNKSKNINLNKNNVQKSQSLKEDYDLANWLKIVYEPIDRILAKVINPFTSNIKQLSLDPYDDELMESFCSYLETSQEQMKKIEVIFRSIPIPNSAKIFGINLYHCFSELQDSLNELELYTQGYVDNYLHDGQEMMRNAKRQRSILHQEKKSLIISKSL